jgi:hypothetical protein
MKAEDLALIQALNGLILGKRPMVPNFLPGIFYLQKTTFLVKQNKHNI